MFAMRRRGGDDVEPMLLCVVCRKPVALRDGWVGFHPVTADHPQSAGQWLHRACLNGQAETLFGGRRVVLWREGTHDDLVLALACALWTGDRRMHRFAPVGD
jgi:hypothetical protein